MSPTSPALALDLARLALRCAAGACPEADLLAPLRRCLVELVGPDAEAVLARARSLEADGHVSASDRALLAWWLGPDADHALLADDRLDLADLLARYPLSDGLRLLDILLDAFGTDQIISGEERLRLDRVARALDVDDTVMTALQLGMGASGRRVVVPLSGGRLRIGRSATCDLSLPDLQVAPHHADLLVAGSEHRIHAVADRVVVVEQQAVKAAPVPAGTPFRIGSFLLEHDGEQLNARSDRRFAALEVAGLGVSVPSRVLVHPMSFVAFTGEVVAIIGPSGSGKSTLVSALSSGAGRCAGAVRYGGHPLTERLSADPGLVGVVPQDDLVLAELTVEETLDAAARLRLPPGTPAATRAAQVGRVLDELDIVGIRSERVGDPQRRGISGGQRKRVNVGQALVGRGTELVFLDEPTSGLDPRAAQGIAHLARQLADHDRLVFIVTHDLTPRVLSQVDHLLLLTRDGRLAFFGPVKQAMAWFGVDSPDAIFDHLGREDPVALAERWAASPLARRWVEARMLLLDRHRPHSDERRGLPVSRLRRVAGNLVTLTSRFVRVRARDRMGLAVMIAQPVLLAGVMVLVFPTVTAHLLLMLTLSSLWFGMSAGVRELLADRAIWRQERRVGVGSWTYLLSKVVVLGPVVGIQSALLVLLAALGLPHDAAGFGAHGFDVVALTGVCALSGLSGMSIGLLVSALASTQAAAVGALVLLLVPQIAFSGLLVPLDHLGPAGQVAASLTHQRHALDAALQTGERVSYLNLIREFDDIPTQSMRVRVGYAAEKADPGSTMAALLAWLAGAGGGMLAAAAGALGVRARWG